VRKGGWWVAGWLATGLGVGLPASGQWVEAPGRGWADLTFYYHDTRMQYGRERTRESIPNGGHAVARSLFVTAALGIVRGIDGWVQIPIHHLRYDDFAAERSSSGFGDPRVFLRAGPALFGLPAVPVAIRGGVKWPGGAFDVDAEIIPLGEGQRDVELLLEAGRSFYPHPFWMGGWAGYRWRAPNRTTARAPGNERFWYVAGGGTLGGAGWKVAAEGIVGDPWRIQGILVPSSPREILQGFLTLDWGVGPGRAGLGVRLPFSGRNLPSGAALSAQYFLRWGEG